MPLRTRLTSAKATVNKLSALPRRLIRHKATLSDTH